jgi:hypothetical protein
MADVPQSLGDQPKPDLVLTRFTEPLPGGRREIIAKFESILSRGGVQKVTIALGKPIEIVQLVDKSSMLPPVESPADDLWDVVRSSNLEELRIADMYSIPDAYELLFHAFAYLDRRKLRARMLFVHDYPLLRTWLRLPETANVDAVYGVETAKQAHAPEDAVILVGVPYDEDNIQDILGLRVPVDVPVLDLPPVTVLRKSKKT